jgi:hypothetical protein
VGRRGSERACRAAYFTTEMEHSPVSAIGAQAAIRDESRLCRAHHDARLLARITPSLQMNGEEMPLTGSFFGSIALPLTAPGSPS